MGKSVWKDLFREIKRTFGRFIAIFAIVAIGVAFFAGVTASSNDMKNSTDHYYDDYNMSDLRLLSSIGFNEDDINVIREDYNEYIMQQLHEYEISLGMIGSAIERMKAKKLISENVQITGRIKSFKSAYLNYERDKKIDDCFGLRIVAKQEELVKIREELAKLLNRMVQKRKNAVVCVRPEKE